MILIYGEHVILGSNGTQLAESMPFSKSTFGYECDPNIVMVFKHHLLMNYFWLGFFIYTGHCCGLLG